METVWAGGAGAPEAPRCPRAAPVNARISLRVRFIIASRFLIILVRSPPDGTQRRSGLRRPSGKKSGYDVGGMHISPLPAPLLQLRGRRFAFYPPIHNLQHNEWIYSRATWSEIVVVNTGTGEAAFVPRAFVGDVSITDHPMVIEIGRAHV